MRNSWNLITSAFDCFFSFFNSCSLGTNIGSKEFLYWHTTSLDIRWQARQRNNHSLLRCLQIGLAKDFTWWNNWQYQPNINPPTHPVCLKQKLIINHHERIQNITSQKCVLIFFQLAGIQLSKKTKTSTKQPSPLLSSPLVLKAFSQAWVVSLAPRASPVIP